MIIANSTAMRACVDLIDRVALDDDPVVIVGPAGSGRTTLARRLHAGSRRGEKPLGVADVSAADDPRRAWEDAERAARGGTVALRGAGVVAGDLLDGLGRDLRHCVVRPVLLVEELDTPLVSELPNAAVVHVPSLAERRREDAAELAVALVRAAAEDLGVAAPDLDAEALDALEAAMGAGLGYRGFAVTVRRAVMLTKGQRPVGLRDLPMDVQAALADAPRPVTTLADASRASVVAALSASRSRAEAARRLGLSSRQLRRRCRALGIAPGRAFAAR